MRSALRIVLAALAVLTVVAAQAQEHGRPPHPSAPHPGAAPAHACLDQKERRAASESGKVIHLATAMHVAKRRMPGSVVRARLCHGRNGLVYVLTVLAHDGKVARLTVDAVKGTLVGGL
jgi:hypothetical protein